MKPVLCMMALLCGCEGVVTVVQPVDISGALTIADGHDGPVRVEAYQAWAGEGSLRYPMRYIDAVWVDTPGDFALTVELPVEEGEGLVLYGWQDRDADGAHCGPGVDDELAGATLVAEGEVPDAVEADLLLDAPCVGATRLYP
jgi:hypothetical protein